ncbi:hypothetical protein HN587_03695 [Candidatus Woesearchaeota archaeon]|jgi:hypothetical protein|nr:hypothetical protein [Candidatus Woesearchaeota archaeon]
MSTKTKSKKELEFDIPSKSDDSLSSGFDKNKFLDLKIIIPIIITIIVLAGLVIFLVGSKQSSTKVVPDISDVDSPIVKGVIQTTLNESEELDQNSVNLIESAIEEQNAELCEHLSKEEGEGSFNQCVFMVAKVKKDAELCESLTDLDGDYSYPHCLSELAIELQIPGLCDLIPVPTGEYSQDYCYQWYARVYQDPSYCNFIYELSGPFSQDACYMYIAEERNDIEFCENIVWETGFNSRNECYQKVAIKTSVSEHCDLITENSEYISQEFCMISINN